MFKFGTITSQGFVQSEEFDPDIDKTVLLLSPSNTDDYPYTYNESRQEYFRTTPNRRPHSSGESPYRLYWSTCFNSNRFQYSYNQYIQTRSSKIPSLGTGDFTIEFWINFVDPEVDILPRHIISRTNDDFSGFQIYIASQPVTTGGVTTAIGGLVFKTDNDVIGTTDAINDNLWHYIVFQRRSGTIQCFVDGVQKQSAELIANMSSTLPIRIGTHYSATDRGNFRGFLSNLRITTRALYDQVSLPTEPFELVENCILLTCKHPRIYDEANIESLENIGYGEPACVEYHPFYSENSTSKEDTYRNHSYYFNQDQLRFVPGRPNTTNTTTEFTVEMWIKPVKYITNQTYVVLDFRTASFTNRPVLLFNGGYLRWYGNGTSGAFADTVAFGTGTIGGSTLNISTAGNTVQWVPNTVLQSTVNWLGTHIYIKENGTGVGGVGTYILNLSNQISTSTNTLRGINVPGQRWQHIAYTVKEGTGRFFVDGVLINTVPDNNTYTMPYDSIVIGKDYNNGTPFHGYISNLRISTECLYTASFVVSKIPLTATTSTELLTCKLENVNDRYQAIIDESSYKHLLESRSVGMARLDNPFNTSTAYSINAGIVITSRDKPVFDLQDDDFTIEFWAKTQSLVTRSQWLAHYQSSISPKKGWVISMNTSTLNADVFFDDTTYINLKTAYTNTGWNHISLVRDSDVLKLFLNGQIASTATMVFPTIGKFSIGSPQADLQIGSVSPSKTDVISGVRIVKGRALYTDNFSTATNPPTNVAGTILLTACENRFKDYSGKGGVIGIGVAGEEPDIAYRGPFIDHINDSGSIAFDGDNNSYLISDPNSQFALSTNNFTVEGFVYWEGWNFSINGASVLLTIEPMQFFLTWNNQIDYPVVRGIPSPQNAGGFVAGTVNAPAVMRCNQWIHWAVQRIGSQWTMFFDGKTIAKTEWTGNPQGGTRVDIGGGDRRVSLGQNMIGNITGVRYTLGEGLYYSPLIEVPTSPLEYLDGTPTGPGATRVLLNHYKNKDNRSPALIFDSRNQLGSLTYVLNEYSDHRSPFSPKGWVSKFYKGSGSSVSGAAIASTSTLKIAENEPFTLEFWAYPYETQTWSAFFDGSSPAIVDASRQFTGPGFAARVTSLINTDFTIECWCYLRSLRGSFFVFGSTSIAYLADLGISFGMNGGEIFIRGSRTDGSNQFSFSTTFPSGIPLNQWNHVAFVRTGTSIYCYLNGVRGPGTTAPNVGDAIDPRPIRTDLATPTGYYIGRSIDNWTETGVSTYIDGWISNFRFNRGTAVYTAPTITPPDRPLKHLPTPGGTNHLRLFDSPGKPGILGTTVNIGNTATLKFKSGSIRMEEFSPVWKNSATETMIYFGRRDLQNTANLGIQITQQDATLGFRGESNSTATWSTATFAAPMAYNTWSHIALVRTTSGHITSYINGVPGITVINTGSIDPYSTEEVAGSTATNERVWFHVGYGPYDIGTNGGTYWTGWMSDLRLVKGQALYLNTFTPSRSRPLEAISGTTLLTLQGIDNLSDKSIVGHQIDPIDPNGYGVDIDIVPLWTQRAGSNLPTQGGICHFVDSNDYCRLPERSYFNLRYISQWTLETWFISDSTTAGLSDLWFLSIGGASWASLAIGTDSTANGFKIYYSNGSAGTAVTTVSSVKRQSRKWYHVAVSRDSNGVIRMFINGKLDISVTPATPLWNGQEFFLNSTPNGGSGGGACSLTGIRFVTESCLYTTDFSVPGSMPKYVPGTKVLATFSDPALIDRSGIHSIEVNNTGSTSTTALEYSGNHGGSSVRLNPYFNYIYECLRIDDKLGNSHLLTPTLNIWYQDFTLEMWINRDNGTGGTLFSLRTEAVISGLQGLSPLRLDIDTNGVLTLRISSDGQTYDVTLNSSVGSSALQWVHVAVSKSGRNNNNLKMFIDGKLVGYITFLNPLATADGMTQANGNTYIGGIGTNPPSNLFRGRIYDLRLTVGKGRYTDPAGFTVPRTQFPIR